MNKMEAVMDLYQGIFPDVRLEKRGTWIRVNPCNGNPPVNLHTIDLLEEVFSVTGKMYEWDSEFKKLLIEYDAEDNWNTGNSWNTQGPIHTTEPATGKQILAAYEREEDCLFDDIGEV